MFSKIIFSALLFATASAAVWPIDLLPNGNVPIFDSSSIYGDEPIISAPDILEPSLVSDLPAPITISNNCNCVKTVLRSQLARRVVNVPTIRRVVQTFNRPVVERIPYNTQPGGSVPSVPLFPPSFPIGNPDVDILPVPAPLSGPVFPQYPQVSLPTPRNLIPISQPLPAYI